MIGKLTMDPGEDTPDYIYGIEIRLDGGITIPRMITIGERKEQENV